MQVPEQRSPAPTSLPGMENEFGPAYTRYIRMRKAGLPDGAVVNAMNRENVPIPPGFFPPDFVIPQHAEVQVTKQPLAPASAPQGGNSMMVALKGFDASKLKHADPSAEGEEEKAKPSNPLFAELEKKSKGGLRKRTQEEVDAEEEEKRKSKIAQKGQDLFNQALIDKFKNARGDDDDEQDKDDGDEEWAM